MRRKIIACFVALCFTLVMLVSPVSMAYAASKGIATLEVEYFYRRWAYAATYSSLGFVSVTLSVGLTNGDRSYTTGDAAGSMYSFACVNIDAPEGYVIRDAISYHYDAEKFVLATWNPPDSYLFYDY